LLVSASVPALALEPAGLPSIRLPPGFRIDFYSRDVPGARSLALGDRGTLFVGTRDEGNVYALVDERKSGRATRRYIVASGLDAPNGVTFLNGDLYVAESRRILRYRAIESRLEEPPKPEVVYDRLPRERDHGWRYLRAGPDGLLYVGIGAPCNICLRPGYANIARLRPDGSHFEPYAEGVRNSVGFDWHPVTEELWFTDNGRDLLGDDQPPDELNHAPRAGLHFGFPFCHGGTIPDPEFGARHPCSGFTPPARALAPHAAALGMRFYTGFMFPEQYRHQVFIAEHGSWNRSRKIGYRITLVRLQGGQAASYEEFATGWLSPDDEVRGRPVDLAVAPDGALLISDDQSGAVYRISYQQTRAR
jgi:glucose/arabinose dehydrogenase